jgi:hypothetical protein
MEESPGLDGALWVGSINGLLYRLTAVRVNQLLRKILEKPATQ